ncbi:hypothetical protein GNY06_02110 [Elizabethkingia argentiflava]|uniref:HTH luxR-type domain-containing protein n=1 Tax=Elizabethkingia argenteiflava TaxID=2681556 RepID=A0A845PT64_9FLAO|nr:hypothetical protein [Elizabethkingia argenteiflava]
MQINGAKKKRQSFPKESWKCCAFTQGGLSIHQIAAKSVITPDTVKFHRIKLFEKTGTKNIVEALAYATSNKLL